MNKKNGMKAIIPNLPDEEIKHPTRTEPAAKFQNIPAKLTIATLLVVGIIKSIK